MTLVTVLQALSVFVLGTLRNMEYCTQHVLPNDVQYVDQGAFAEWQPSHRCKKSCSDEICYSYFLYIADRFTE